MKEEKGSGFLPDFKKMGKMLGLGFDKEEKKGGSLYRTTEQVKIKHAKKHFKQIDLLFKKLRIYNCKDRK